MRRLVAGCVAAALVLGIVGVRVLDPVSAPAARRAPEVARARPDAATLRLALFGDSLTYQARSTFEPRLRELAPGGVTLSTRPGAALCDDRDAIVRDLVTRRPAVAVLEYSGNSLTDCMRSDDGVLLRIGSRAWLERYQRDLDAIVAIAATTGTTIVWATAPPVEHAPAPVDYPEQVAAIARHLATVDPGVQVADTGRALEARGAYSSALACRAEETMFCRDGRITVRASDGLHFDCIGPADRFGGCLGYSAGARRFGDALVTAVERVSSSRSPHP